MLTILTLLALLSQDQEKIFPDDPLELDRILVEEGYRGWPTIFHFDIENDLKIVSVIKDFITSEEWNDFAEEMRAAGLELTKDGFIDESHAEEYWNSYYYCAKTVYKIYEQKLLIMFYICENE